ncbi:hypothetical protein OFM13_32510, partial [Escherichia coli]|nr:hypothetical protein [Escherichia coli]
YGLEEVAARAKLSKTPEQYAQAGRSEAVYEALLASGRSRWAVGERVRLYRAAGGVWRLLPEDPEAAPRDYDVGHYVRLLRES